MDPSVEGKANKRLARTGSAMETMPEYATTTAMMRPRGVLG